MGFGSSEGYQIQGAMDAYGPVGSAARAKSNSEAQKKAAEQAIMWTMWAGMQAEKLQKQAIAAAEKAQKEATATAIAAAEEAAAKAEEATKQANAYALEAVKSGADFSNREFSAAYDQIQSMMQPYVDSGRTANDRLTRLTTGTPEEVNALVMSDPSYQFRMDQGLKARERSAAAKGNLFSGRTGTAIEEYGQDFASQEFTNAFNRLMALSTQGQGAANTLSGYRQGLAGSRSQNNWMVQNQDAQGRLNEANQGNQSAWNIANAKSGGAQNNANVAIKGAWDLGSLGINNAFNTGNAFTNKAASDAASTVYTNQQINADTKNLVNTALSIVSSVYGKGAGAKKKPDDNINSGNSLYSGPGSSSDWSGSSNDMWLNNRP